MSVRYSRALRLGVLAGAAAVVVSTAAPAYAIEKPDFQMPFGCEDRWEASSWSGHSPSALSVDWNRDAYDEGQPVLAAASGVVTSVVDLGDSSYGLYVVVDHGGGWSTLHAHLLRSFVAVGQLVDQGQVIGLLGNSGGSTGAHLHYEQRLNRTDQQAVFDGSSLVYNSWVTSRNCVDVPITGDWNGDRTSDVGTFAHRAAGGIFRQRLPGGTIRLTKLGLSVDQPVVGDWNGDGQSDQGVYNTKARTFTLLRASGKRTTLRFGRYGDLPLAGDWNGDGRSEVGVFRPANHTFYLRAASGTYSTRVLGSVSSLPVVGDWDGDGRFEPGVYDQAARTFTLLGANGEQTKVVFGTATSLPVVGYWGYDAVTDLGVWDTTTSTFSKRLTVTRVATIRFGKLR
ncbi:MAG: M23 family metallopeptidase [Nocardioidaceae bacterium]|nr:M23 family metallopeptidase [Nocardioidaceae bacterium]